MLLVILTKMIEWIKNNLLATILAIALVSVLLYKYSTSDSTASVVISPYTKTVKYDNGSIGQSKVLTPETKIPEESGFSKEFVRDTINKIMGVKNKEIKYINEIKGKYKDSLSYVREELDKEQGKIVYYESKDRNGNVVGSGKVVAGNGMVYTGDVDFITVVKAGKKVDTIKFYDPSQRFTINKSKEFTYISNHKTDVKRITFSIQTGAGVVIPSFDLSKATFGGYVGVGVSYNFK